MSMRCMALALMLLPAAAFAVEPASTETEAQMRARAQQDAEQIAQHMLQVQESPSELNCPVAVDNARHGVQTMLEVGQKNVDSGFMKAEQFTPVAGLLRAMLPMLTLDDCQAATDKKRDFYQCMSSNHNHLMACAQAHPF
ncbi:hypothetical protein [Stenotrophomonas sp.]|uniref:hypothetical protein n=1 Tax=Stenotrophomonas sp. TaxID=69392 RepID=UPI00289E36F0|nr:hypothetical protein [Stenotrophomonas sp.]